MKLNAGLMAGIYLAAGPDFYFDFEKKSGIDKKKAQVGINVGAGLKLLNVNRELQLMWLIAIFLLMAVSLSSRILRDTNSTPVT